MTRESLPSPKPPSWFDRISLVSLLAGLGWLVTFILRRQEENHHAREHVDGWASDESLAGDEFNPSTTPPPEDRSGAGSR